MARGSNLEIQTQITIAAELGFTDDTKRKSVEGLSNEVSKMLVALMRTT
jgi:four helix bundle protein